MALCGAIVLAATRAVIRKVCAWHLRSCCCSTLGFYVVYFENTILRTIAILSFLLADDKQFKKYRNIKSGIRSQQIFDINLANSLLLRLAGLADLSFISRNM